MYEVGGGEFHSVLNRGKLLLAITQPEYLLLSAFILSELIAPTQLPDVL